VIVTRAEAQAPPLVEALERLGARVLAAPVFDLADPPAWEPCDAALERIGAYAWVVLTSANAVERFVARGGRALLARLAAGEPRVAAIGAATARRVAAAGLPVALVAREARAEGLLAAFADQALAGRRVLLPRALEARDELPAGLRARGAIVDVVPVYRMLPRAALPAAVADALRAGEAHAVTLLSARTARAFVAALGASLSAGEAARALAALRPGVIGPVTAAEAAVLGFAAPIVAPGASAAGIVAAVVAAFEEPTP
jgi:uroporphyrinogen III methyltransferase/synthase